MEREKNRLIDELSLKDQQLQQADTIIAELHGEIVQSKRNVTRRHVQSKRGAIGVTKIGHGQPDHAPGNRPSEAGTEEYPRTSQPARQWPAGEMLPTMRHGVVAKTSNLDPTPTCRAGTEREKNQLIDEPSLKDQQLQQVDTIIAELQDENHSVKTKRHPPARPVKTRRKPRYKNRSWTTRPWARQSTKAKQEPKNIRQQIADGKSSAQPCNCDYDQLLNSIVHEPVDVNRRVLLSTANDVSRYCDSNPPAHHNRTADRSRFGSSKPLLEHQADDNSKPTCCHRIPVHFYPRNCGRIRPDTD